MERITSLHNPRIKEFARLRERSGREAQQRIIIDGAREIGRAFHAGLEFVELIVCETSLRDAARAVVETARQRNVRITHVSASVIAKLSFGSRDEGVVAIARTPGRSLHHIALPANPLVAVLEGVEKPGNIGAVMRSADAAGVSAVLLADVTTDLFNPNAIRASAGTLFALPAAAASSHEIHQWLGKQAVRVFVTEVDAPRPYTDADFTGPTAVVLGSESAGVRSAWAGNDVTRISLPMRGVADSLNVSVAAAVLFYEAMRQRLTKA